MKKSRISLMSVVAIMTLSSCVIEPNRSVTVPSSPTSDVTTQSVEPTVTTGPTTLSSSSITSATPQPSSTETPSKTSSSVPQPTSASSSTTSTSKPTTTSTSGGEGPGSYYDGISKTATGTTLKSQLYNLIKNHDTSHTDYDTLEVAMRITDRNWEKSPDPNDENPWMNLLYMVGNETTPHRWNTYHGSGGMLEGAHWDKEHIWVKSNGFPKQSLPAHYDLHHLRASDMKNNNTRSNLPYGPVSGGTTVYDYDGNPSGKKTSSCYEPLDRDKGDVARAIMYMATRYSTGDGSGGTSLTLTDGTESTGGKFGYLSTLLKWNLQDPPDAWEMHRNYLIYSQFQHNRNPFIDNPDYACRIWSGTSSATQAACK